MSNVPNLARPDEPAVHERQGDRQDWRVQIFRYTLVLTSWAEFDSASYVLVLF